MIVYLTRRNLNKNVVSYLISNNNNKSVVIVNTIESRGSGLTFDFLYKVWEGGGPDKVVEAAKKNNFISRVRREVSSHSSNHPKEDFLTQFSLYAHRLNSCIFESRASGNKY